MVRKPGSAPDPVGPVPDPEAVLVARVAAGDQKAFAELYVLYRRRLARFLGRFLASADTVEELINDVMFVVWQEAVRFESRSRVSTWIFGIAWHKALRALERQRRNGHRSASDPDRLPAVERENLDERDWLRRGLDQLSPELYSDAEITALNAAGIGEIVVARLEAGDIPEDAAAANIAAGVGDASVSVDHAFTGRCNLFAREAGVLVVNRAAIDALNRVDEAITFATLPEFKPVVAGEMIATVKIIPFAVGGEPHARARDRESLSPAGAGRALPCAQGRRDLDAVARPRRQGGRKDTENHRAAAGAGACVDHVRAPRAARAGCA